VNELADRQTGGREGPRRGAAQRGGATRCGDGAAELFSKLPRLYLTVSAARTQPVAIFA